MNITHLRASVALAAILLLTTTSCSTRTPRPAPVTVPQIVEMSKAGTPETEILQKMRESGAIYRLQASQLSELTQQGVSTNVIDYMQQTYLNAVRRDATYERWDSWTPYGRHWYGGSPYGWPNDRIIVIREPPRALPPPPPAPRPKSPSKGK
ncbi:MAG: hypothetical protein R6X19_01575 [Kiritimatiellia bacterium]